MQKFYFDMMDDVHVRGRWELDNPRDSAGIDLPDMFEDGRAVDFTSQIWIPVRRQGTALDFSFTIGMAVPIVHERVAGILSALAPGDVQLFHASIESQRDLFYLVNIVTKVKCIDDAASR